jgi:hypothetical protein
MRDSRDYEEMHKYDTHPNLEHRMLMDNFPSYEGLTDSAQAIARNELERHSLNEFKKVTAEAGSLRNYIKSIIEMHSAWGVEK